MVKTPGVVRIAAVGDIHLGRAAYGPPDPDPLRPGGGAGGRAGPLRRPHRPGRPGGGTAARPGARDASACRSSPCSATTTTSRRRCRSSAGSSCDAGRPGARRRRRLRDPRGRVRRGEGVRRRVRPPGTRAPGARRPSSCSCARRSTRRSSWRRRSASSGRSGGWSLLHYSPIAGTVEGEPPEIYPYLGSSRLEEPLIRYPVDVVFHGHAHHGTLEGKTVGGVTVYNVSLSLLQRSFPDGRRSGSSSCDAAARNGRSSGRADRDSDRRAEPQPGRRTTDRAKCHPERSEGAITGVRILRFAQDDTVSLSRRRESPSRPARRSRSSRADRASPPAPPSGAAVFFSSSCFTVSPVATASLASLAASA